MSTRAQILLLVLIALMASLGFAATTIIGQQESAFRTTEAHDLGMVVEKMNDLNAGRMRPVPTVATIEEATSTEGSSVDVGQTGSLGDIGQEVFQTKPTTSYFQTGSSTFVVMHWNADQEFGRSAVSVWFTKKDDRGYDTQLQHVFSDLAGSCGQPFSYGMTDGYFYIHKNLNPCEGMSQDWEWWFDEEGHQVVEYDSYNDTAGQSFRYQLMNGQPQDVGLIVDTDCSVVPVPSDLSVAEDGSNLPKFVISGVFIGTRKVLFPTAVHETCYLNELNGPNYAAPPFSTHTSGTVVTLDAPDTYSVRFDVRHPEQAKVLNLK